ncbi:MAG: tRNA-dihydrouridine synthase family protein [Ruminococcaceae bacterium]|nr:tRNA-dihydrouridine synthase family protein [Oscillospiraceae bacterium]
MKIYFAPLEGITNYIFRNAYNGLYGYIDKYFAPFISPSEKCPITPRERKDLIPDHNTGICLVPQLLTCRSNHFIEGAQELKTMGYTEVNLNLGCPSGTVCGKGKGAGFLPNTLELQRFLDDIYSYSESDGMKISIKTRLGYFNPDEFYDLIDIFNQYPVYELIVHPRIRSDFYKGEPRKEYFAYALEHSKCPLVYNGNIYSVSDYEETKRTFGTDLDPVMLGRGLIADPSLAGKLKGNIQGTDFAKFKMFHDTLYHEYQKIMSPDINVIYKMRELWSYWQLQFEGSERDIKKLLKAKKYSEYEDAVYRILDR